MSIVGFVLALSWCSFFALTWLLIFNYLKVGQGMSPMMGWFVFLIAALLSSLFNSISEGGDKNEPVKP